MLQNTFARTENLHADELNEERNSVEPIQKSGHFSFIDGKNETEKFQANNNLMTPVHSLKKKDETATREHLTPILRFESENRQGKLVQPNVIRLR